MVELESCEVKEKVETGGTKETKVLLPVKVGIPEVIRPAVKLLRNAGGLEHLVAGLVVVMAELLLVLVLLVSLVGELVLGVSSIFSTALLHRERCGLKQPVWIFL